MLNYFKWGIQPLVSTSIIHKKELPTFLLGKDVCTCCDILRSS